MVKVDQNRIWHRAIVMTLVGFIIVSCGSASTQVPSMRVTPEVATTTLRSLAQARQFSIGTAVNVDALQYEPQYSEILAREFNMVTPEVTMKFDATEPRRGVYIFNEADSIVAFARAHAMQVRGHNLAWYLALPAWLTTGKFTRNALITILHDHIFAEVAHYRGQVNIWDAVNEAVNDDGSLRNSIWLRGIGPDYLDLAFRWAHEANTQARLFYNDYGGEGLGRKSDAIYTLLKGLLKRGVPIDGVGLQMHISLNSYPKPQDVLANMQRLAALGLEVQVTEMDVKIQDDVRSMQARLDAQASIYRDMLSTCLSVERCTAFVMWGFTDAHSWIPAFTGHPDAPLIFDEQYRPKAAYFALVGVLESASSR